MYDILQLNDMLVPELLDIAEDLKIENSKKEVVPYQNGFPSKEEFINDFNWFMRRHFIAQTITIIEPLMVFDT